MCMCTCVCLSLPVRICSVDTVTATATSPNIAAVQFFSANAQRLCYKTSAIETGPAVDCDSNCTPFTHAAYRALTTLEQTIYFHVVACDFQTTQQPMPVKHFGPYTLSM